MNLNHFVITGNITRDLELRYTVGPAEFIQER